MAAQALAEIRTMTNQKKPSDRLSLLRSIHHLNGPVLLGKRHAEQFNKRLANLLVATKLDVPGGDDGNPEDPTKLPSIRPSYDEFTKVNGMATIPIVGVLTKYSSWYDGWLGLTSTLRIQNDLDNAVADPNIQGITLLIDCPGGYADGTFELASSIMDANKKKPVYAVVSDLCASGGYLLASQSRSISASDKSFIGAIGVYTVLCDDSKFWEDLGIGWKLISSGGIKGEGADGKVSQELIDDQQREIDSVYELFISRVSAGRDLSDEETRKLADGRCWIASEAKTMGLIDSVASIDASMTAILQEIQNMTLEEFNTFAKANPQAVKPFHDAGVEAGKTAGIEQGANAERDRFKALHTKFGTDRPGFVCDQFAKGNDLAKASVELSDVLMEENKQLKANAGKLQNQQQEQQPIGTNLQAENKAEQQNQGGNAEEQGMQIAQNYSKRFGGNRAAAPAAR